MMKIFWEFDGRQPQFFGDLDWFDWFHVTFCVLNYTTVFADVFEPLVGKVVRPHLNQFMAWGTLEFQQWLFFLDSELRGTFIMCSQLALLKNDFELALMYSEIVPRHDDGHR